MDVTVASGSGGGNGGFAYQTVSPKAVEWSPALAAAVIDHELTDRTPVEAFTRDHMIALRNAGCSREQVRDYLTHIFANRKVRRGGKNVSAVDHILTDLDSYGDWVD